MTDEKTPAQGAVACGVTFLDDIMPDWRAKVDLEILDLSDPQVCILGQVFNSDTQEVSPWTRGTWALADWLAENSYVEDEMTDSPVIMFGFEHDIYVQSYDELEAEWRKVIAS